MVWFYGRKIDLSPLLTPHGRWRYKCAPQGFVSSGDGYNRRFDAVHADFPRKERCIDDICHFDANLVEHWWRTIDLLIILGKSEIILNPQKFQFAKRSVEFAGFRVSESAIEPLPKYLDAIRGFPTPKNVTDVRSWFGLVNQMANYAQLRDLIAPFKVFLSPRHQFSWSAELDDIFEASKDAIIRAICKGVEIFDITRKTCLRTDWSAQGIGYYLSQKHCDCSSPSPNCCVDGWKITLAGSRFLHGPEQRYAAIEGEALAVAWSLEHTKYFTQGCDNLLIVTDHQPLVKILGDRTLDEIANTRLFRLKQQTLPWKFSIMHLPGPSNKAADATSRYPSTTSEKDITSHRLSDEDSAEECFNAAIAHETAIFTTISWVDIVRPDIACSSAPDQCWLSDKP